MSSNNNQDTNGIKAIFILEIIGRPAEHLVETLNKIIDEISKEKGVKVIEKKIKEPVEMENRKDFYTTFAEVEIDVEEILQLAILMFKYMPSNIEIIEPELISLSNTSWSDILSELTRRLHGYDEIARVLQIENAKMKRMMSENKESKENKEE